MKANELRQRGEEDLDKQLHELLKEQFNLRMQQGTGQLSRPSQMRAVRRDIARIKTIMTEKKAGSGQ
jgi:large subunit ribosomal protein L29